jgi:hypothetical protein
METFYYNDRKYCLPRKSPKYLDGIKAVLQIDAALDQALEFSSD